jgi:hypothetical protein
MTANQPGRFIQDAEGLHYYAATYAHHATNSDVRAVLRTIREMSMAGIQLLRPLEIVVATGLAHTRVRVALRWLAAVAPAWRRVRFGKFKVADALAWQREVAAAWLAIDDPDDVTPFDLTDVFGDDPPPPDPPDPEDCDGAPDAPGPALADEPSTSESTAGPDTPPLALATAA